MPAPALPLLNPWCMCACLQVRLWARWVRARQLLRTWAERVWTYLWDGPPEGEADEAGGTGAGAYETEVSAVQLRELESD